MSDFDSLFDSAMRQADDAIRQTFGVNAELVIDGERRQVFGDFYDPSVTSHLPGMSAVLDGTLPALFISSSDASGLKERDTVFVDNREFWVFRISPDDSGSRHISLKTGKPPADSRFKRQ